MNCAGSWFFRSSLFPQFASMFSVLRYGTDSSIRLEWPGDTLVAECGTPRQPPLENPAKAVAAVLAEPLDYPPLARGVTPSDRVVLALEEGVPQAGEIVAAVIAALMAAGVDPDGVMVLRSLADVSRGVPDPCRFLPETLRKRVKLATHDPENRDRLAYLTLSARGEPLLLNRAIVEADMVLPIGCLSSRKAAFYHGIHAAVFPTFADRATLDRFRLEELRHTRQSAKRERVHECDEVGWLLGLNFTIQVVPGAGDEILHVLAGQFASVRRRGRELYEAAWSWWVPRQASLVLAAIQGSSLHQTWQNVARALAAAGPLVEDGGAIAVCCELAAEPGPAVRCLARSRAREAALHKVCRDCPEDALAAAELAKALDRVDVYLLSRLEESLVEELEMAPVNRPEELMRLVRRYPSCIVLSNAPRVRISVVED